MNGTSVDSYRDIAVALSPPAVSQYLATHDWELELREADVREVWRLSDEGGPRGRIMLPLATDYVDFQSRFLDSLRALGLIYGWDPPELAERIAATRADLFFVRLDQVTADGTIPFKQAEKVLEGLFKMMKAAATTADDPYHSHRGRRSATVTEFLDDDVRLGHTKRGSFVFTVVTRLGDLAPSHSDGEAEAGFPRQVMETLARGLQATRDLALTWNEGAVDRAGQSGLSASLVESLLELAQPDTLRALDLSFDWAVAAPPPRVDVSRILVGRDTMAGLPRVRERLVRREQPPRRETVVGTVRTLNREEPGDDDQETTNIVLSAHVRGRLRNIHVQLSGDDYEWAIRAHFRKLPFTVTGDLIFERGAWRLTGEIVVDPSFLRHH